MVVRQRDLPDGGIELHLRLSILHEVKLWVMSLVGDGLPKNSIGLTQMLLASARSMVAKPEADLARQLAAAGKAPGKSPRPPSA